MYKMNGGRVERRERNFEKVHRYKGFSIIQKRKLLWNFDKDDVRENF